MRFALVEMKVCLAMVASTYWMDVDQRTQQPLQFERKAFSPKAEGGLWLKFKKRQAAVIKKVVE
ncbi:hypothetical protein J6590_050986 [Homalodisca vitripennis]|nr:hypothetical protein J6590_050986 [Homalodisca vitripennis]